MTEKFLHLEAQEQSQILRGLAPRLQRSAAVLEKDIWVCWALQTLFALPDHLPMAFKGGTSLSKVFRLIDRFSEDIDITLDYSDLDKNAKPFAKNLSRNQLKKLSERLKNSVREHIHTIIAPYFRQQLESQFGSSDHTIHVSDNGEQLRIYYPTSIHQEGRYLSASVLLEFGGRNIIEPHEEHVIRPDIAPYLKELIFPEATISVLIPARTFWEKATLIHAECSRNEFRSNPERLSRHWYDMAMLADSPAGEDALKNTELLVDVIRHKQVFFSSSTSNYDACLQDKFRLLPSDTAFAALRHDYQQMINAGMFIGTPLTFEQVIERLYDLEKKINSKVH